MASKQSGDSSPASQPLGHPDKQPTKHGSGQPANRPATTRCFPLSLPLPLPLAVSEGRGAEEIKQTRRLLSEIYIRWTRKQAGDRPETGHPSRGPGSRPASQPSWIRLTNRPSGQRLACTPTKQPPHKSSLLPLSLSLPHTIFLNTSLYSLCYLKVYEG